MCDRLLLISRLEKIEFAIQRILSTASEITSPSYYLLTNAGMERLERCYGVERYYSHHYFDIDAETVFDVGKNDLPDLKVAIHRMIKDGRLLCE